MADVQINIDSNQVRRLALNSQRLDEKLRATSERVVAAAEADFTRQNRGDNELRTSETTPPKYIGSFYVEKIEDGEYHAGNSDPAWNLVEYGSHPGGNPRNFVLRYRPLGHALDIVAE